MRNLFRILVLTLLFTACQDQGKQDYTLYLADLEFGAIADPYGPPLRNLSFAENPINISGEVFERGIGVHAPSRLQIGLNKKGIRFEAVIGMDRSIAILYDKEKRDALKNRAGYVYDNHTDHYDYTAGGTAVFKVKLDGKVVFVSDTMTIGSAPIAVTVPLKRAEEMELIVEDAGDGSYADYANWADARIMLRDPEFRPVVLHALDKIIVNTDGFHPSGLKYGYIHQSEDPAFRIVDAASGKPVCEGTGVPTGDDLGRYYKCDFSEVEQPGSYYMSQGNLRSDTFRISSDIYAEALALHMEYLTLQRSGHPEKGWAKNVHLDDGKRDDNGKHQDVTGGWYDASDIRKPTAGNAQLLFALTHVMESQPAGISFEALLEEAKWGNKFLFSMQEPEGYLMNYIGFTWEGYADNRWTDNIVGTADDRTIITRPANTETHLLFVLAELKLAVLLKEADPVYAQTCFERALRCYRWVEKQKIQYAGVQALVAIAGMQLYGLTGESSYLKQATGRMEEVCRAFSDGGEGKPVLFTNISRSNTLHEFGWVLYGMSEFLEQNPDHEISVRIGEIAATFREKTLEPFSRANAFSIMPWLLSGEKMEGAREMGGAYYKYFLHVGMNRHLALDAFGLLKMEALTGSLPVVHGHYDWILGANPYNASTVTGIGLNQPDLFKTNDYEFRPPTPLLPGGVMTGMGGTPDDRIAMRPGWWWTTEYWSPPVMAMILLTNEMNEFYNKQRP